MPGSSRTMPGEVRADSGTHCLATKVQCQEHRGPHALSVGQVGSLGEGGLQAPGCCFDRAASV